MNVPKIFTHVLFYTITSHNIMTYVERAIRKAWRLIRTVHTVTTASLYIHLISSRNKSNTLCSATFGWKKDLSLNIRSGSRSYINFFFFFLWKTRSCFYIYESFISRDPKNKRNTHKIDYLLYVRWYDRDKRIMSIKDIVLRF